MRVTASFASVCLPAAIAGCFVSADPAAVLPTPSDGTLTVAWTINGSTDPNQCNQSSANTIQVTVNPGGVFGQSCSAFDLNIPLAPGSYSASAVLLDASGMPRTTAVPIDPFSISGDDDLNTPIDFPASSFF